VQRIETVSMLTKFIGMLLMASSDVAEIRDETPSNLIIVPRVSDLSVSQ
jgi:hypothetical protein